MKKAFLLAAVAVVVTVSANAQNRFDKGDWLVGVQGAGLGFESRFNDGNGGSRDLNASVFGGWFLLDKLAFDLSAGLSHTSVGSKSRVGYAAGYTKTTLFDFSGGVRYYPVGNLFARIGYHGKTGTDTWAQYLGAKVGYDIFLSKNVFFEPAVYYEKNLNKRMFKGQQRENVLGVSFGFGMRF